MVCLELEASAFRIIVEAHSLQMMTTMSRLKELQTERLQTVALSETMSPPAGSPRGPMRRGSVYIDAYRVVRSRVKLSVKS